MCHVACNVLTFSWHVLSIGSIPFFKISLHYFLQKLNEGKKLIRKIQVFAFRFDMGSLAHVIDLRVCVIKSAQRGEITLLVRLRISCTKPLTDFL
jgi:hypothetical protein